MHATASAHPYRIAIAGLGAIGQAIATALACGQGIPGVRLSAVARYGKAEAFLRGLHRPPVVADLAGLPALADVVIECAPAHLLAQIAEPALRAGKRLIVLSSGALLLQPRLFDLAEQHGGQILVPSGALGGLDAVRAMAEGRIDSARLITTKPPAALRDAPYLLAHGIHVDRLDQPLCVFSGSAIDAVRGFPANLNVAAALALAGIGGERTMVELWADPAASGNAHRIEIASDAGKMSMTIAGTASANPKTGRMAAQSVLAMLRRLGAPQGAPT